MLGRDYVEHCSKVSGVFAFVSLSFSFLLITIVHNYQGEDNDVGYRIGEASQATKSESLILGLVFGCGGLEGPGVRI